MTATATKPKRATKAYSAELPVERIAKEMLAEAGTLSRGQARYLVDLYYAIQDFRIQAGGQVRAALKEDESSIFVPWIAEQYHRLEKEIQKILDIYSSNHPAGRWAKSIVGVGPVIAAGLLAHIDPERAITAGDVWRHAGIDGFAPKKEKGVKRYWNADLRCLTWKIGECFVKTSNHENSVYGRMYKIRKELEIARNDEGRFADQAATKLENFKIGKDTDAYKAYSTGKLPPAHIHARARRYAVKLFLAHFQHVLYESHHGKQPPKPYVFEHLSGHNDYVAPPNWPEAA